MPDQLLANKALSTINEATQALRELVRAQNPFLAEIGIELLESTLAVERKLSKVYSLLDDEDTPSEEHLLLEKVFAEVFDSEGGAILRPSPKLVEEIKKTLEKDSESADKYTSEMRANAYRIAAEPDLLEVCETLIKRWESDIIPPAEKLSHCIGMLRDAIAKAKGEQ